MNLDRQTSPFNQAPSPEVEKARAQAKTLYTSLIKEGKSAQAESVDAVLLSTQERLAIRTEAFNESVRKLFERNINSSSLEQEVGYIKRYISDFNIPDELAAVEIKGQYLQVRQVPPLFKRRSSKGNFDETVTHNEEQLRVFQQAVESFGETISPEEIEAAKERGILKKLQKGGVNFLNDQSELEQTLGWFGKTTEVLHEDRYEEALLENFFRENENFSNFSVYSWRQAFKNGLFPVDKLREPENQSRFDELFVKNFTALLSEDGLLREAQPGDSYWSQDGIQCAANAIQVAHELGVSEVAARQVELQVVVKSYLCQMPSHRKWSYIVPRAACEYFEVKVEDYASFFEQSVIDEMEEEGRGFYWTKELEKAGYLSEEFIQSERYFQAYLKYIKSQIGKVNDTALNTYFQDIPLFVQRAEDPQLVELRELLLFHMLRKGNFEHINRFVEQVDISAVSELLEGPEVLEVLNQHIENILQEIGEYSHQLEQAFKNYTIILGGDQLKSSYDAGSVLKIKELREIIRFADTINQGDLVRRAFARRVTDKNILVLGKYKVALEELFGPELDIIIGPTFEKLLADIGKGSYRGTHGDTATLKHLEKYRDSGMFSRDQLRQLAERAFTLQILSEDDRGGSSCFPQARVIADDFSFKQSFLIEQVERGYIYYLSKDKEWEARELVRLFPEVTIDTSTQDRLYEKQLVEALESGESWRAVNIVEKVNLDNMQLTAEQLLLVRRLYIQELQNGNVDSTQKLATFFKLKITPQEIIDEVPEVRDYFDRLRDRFPILAERFQVSLEALIAILPVLKEGRFLHTLETHPVLAQALEGNPAYAMKLLGNFPILDKLSKANIEFLLSAKEEILAERDGLTADSPDFRKIIQERLLSYRNNTLIASALEQKGVKIDQWLAHEEETYVELGESKRTLAEQIEPAVTRITESLEQYIADHRTTLKEWQKELAQYQVPLADLAVIHQELEKMNARLASADGKTAEGIQKGIDNLNAQLANPKTASAWDRLNGDFSRLLALKKDTLSAFQALQEAESEFVNIQASDIGSREKRAALQEKKSEIKKLKTSVLDKAQTTGKQIEMTRTKLEQLLEGPLGTDRAQSLTQEIAEKVGEPLDHAFSDIRTIESALLERESDLDGTSLRIALWDRNPDVDLYLGNYTDCCIRIDSDHMQSESVIADYLSDIGMQVITVTDEKKNVPVVAAWCWIGVTNDDEVSFVIDNIEANTDYSTQYKELLERKLKDYIERYAKMVGVPHVVQGPQNNDLWVGNLIKSSHYKVGGYNRPSGYYLEGEDTGGEDEHDEDWMQYNDGGENEDWEEQQEGEDTGDEHEDDEDLPGWLRIDEDWDEQ